MVREHENAKQSLVEKTLKLAGYNARVYKCCHNIRSTKTRIETRIIIQFPYLCFCHNIRSTKTRIETYDDNRNMLIGKGHNIRSTKTRIETLSCVPTLRTHCMSQYKIHQNKDWNDKLLRMAATLEPSQYKIHQNKDWNSAMPITALPCGTCHNIRSTKTRIETMHQMMRSILQ